MVQLSRALPLVALVAALGAVTWAGVLLRVEDPLSTPVIAAEDPYTHAVLVREHLRDGVLDPRTPGGALYPPGFHAVLATLWVYTGFPLEELARFGAVPFGAIGILGVALLLFRHESGLAAGAVAAVVGALSIALMPEHVFRTNLTAPTAMDLALLPFLLLMLIELFRGRVAWVLPAAALMLLLVAAHPWVMLIVAVTGLGFTMLVMAFPWRARQGGVPSRRGIALAAGVVGTGLAIAAATRWRSGGTGFGELGDEQLGAPTFHLFVLGAVLAAALLAALLLLLPRIAERQRLDDAARAALPGLAPIPQGGRAAASEPPAAPEQPAASPPDPASASRSASGRSQGPAPSVAPPGVGGPPEASARPPGRGRSRRSRRALLEAAVRWVIGPAAVAAYLALVVGPAAAQGMPSHVDLPLMIGWPVLVLAAAGLLLLPGWGNPAAHAGAAMFLATLPFTLHNPLDSPFWPHRTAVYLGLAAALLAGFAAGRAAASAHRVAAWIGAKLREWRTRWAGRRRKRSGVAGATRGGPASTPLRPSRATPRHRPHAGIVPAVVALLVGAAAGGAVIQATPAPYEDGWYRYHDACGYGLLRIVAERANQDPRTLVVTGSWQSQMVVQTFTHNATRVWYDEAFFDVRYDHDGFLAWIARDHPTAYVVTDGHLRETHPQAYTSFLRSAPWTQLSLRCTGPAPGLPLEVFAVTYDPSVQLEPAVGRPGGSP